MSFSKDDGSNTLEKAMFSRFALHVFGIKNIK